ncbi:MULTISPECIES: cupin domain-containing protein [unclassified Mesorhizobium]|uniref:cupin domain-containing protein n=1 Tax=unclassified Mesorhizobium TaxID=325217 RepID=UPI000BB0ADA1|nr:MULTISPECIES: cupin domain-containing protein [unclassified Mesorhizobium]TGT58576.1 anti-Sigm factor, ChrR [Mesorhizobium sp. M00.F.Ca.ET.170.01.1.1]AZO12042.1 anti-Sigm factor, ChrR [Mesorhizobium sp. M3A.F.Ca.ET.080.04.2.1]PBB84331.1 anti-Sigm factor, ChrR [Mesorhizobium sp. WSM3876]RWB74758.1 MAG: anti-Sigm factor, ChrR [Mesorhizobium sp.]RWB89783.1 MAG: anti-Sigm factor, ChrR [Mesorhizobium sp.]
MKANERSESTAETWSIEGGSSARSGIRAPVLGSRYFSSSSAEWEPTDASGFWIKPLYEDAARGEKTMLMKVDAGAYAGSHTHPGEFEQIYVIEGSFYDQDHTLGPGEYCCRAPDAAHSSGSKDGALVLLIYTRREPAADE